MGTLTLAEIKGEIRAALGNRTDEDSRLTTAINLSQMRIARKHRWEELEALYNRNFEITSSVYNDKFVAFPSNLRDIYSVIVLDGYESRKLIRVPYRRWDRVIPSPEQFSRGTPSHYTLFRNTMELWKVPDEALETIIRAVEWPTSFGSDETALSDLDQKDDMIITLTVSWFLMTQGREDDANKWWGIYKNLMNDAGAEEDERPDLDLLPGPGAGSNSAMLAPYYQDPFQQDIPD